MEKNKLAFVGCIEYGYNLLITLYNNKINIDYIISLDEEKAKKANISGYKNFTNIAQELNIPIYFVDRYDMKSENDLMFFQKNKFDVLLPGGWNRLIPDTILDTLSQGSIGVHGSSDFLPRGRGRSPLNWSLIEGKKRFILHLFLMKKGADDGDIIDFEQFEINEFDTIKTLYYKNIISTRTMLLRSLQNVLNNTVETWKQEGTPTYYSKRTEADGLINWQEWDVDAIYNFIRALTKPYPGAFAYNEGKKVNIWNAQIFDRTIKYQKAKYGEIVEIFDKKLIVNCLGGTLLITDYEYDASFQLGQCFNEKI